MRPPMEIPPGYSNWWYLVLAGNILILVCYGIRIWITLRRKP